MWISDVSIKRPVFAVMLIAALVALGAVASGRIGVDLFPRVEFPYVMINTALEGASPETIETEVTDVLEEEINTIAGLRSLRSESAEGLSLIVAEFDLDLDVNVKAQDVRDKVARVLGKLPPEVESPIIEKLDPDASPILSVMISGDKTPSELSTFAKSVVKDRIQRIPGVGTVTLVGGREREIRIWLDANRLRAYGVTADDVINALRREHADIPGGLLESAGKLSEFAVKTKGEVETVAEFEDIVIMYRSGRPTTIADVARVEDGLEDERTYAEFNGRPGISLDVRRQSGENTLVVANAVKRAVDDIKKTLPAGMELVIARDISVFIGESARDVGDDIMLGVLLVVLVTLAFLLNPRATVIVAIAMPTSLISAFFLLYIAEFSINVLTLLALSLSVGLLVDDAIVVLESIHRKLDEGLSPLEAASQGVREVGAAVFSGTIAIVAVFVPIAFMEGVIGKFFYQYGLTIVFAVMVSLLVSITLTPALASRWLTKETNLKGPLAQKVDRWHEQLSLSYRNLLEVSLRHRWIVGIAALFFVSTGVFAATTLSFGFDSRADRSEFVAQIELPYGVGIEGSRQIAQRAAAQLSEVEHVRGIFVTIGADQKKKVNLIDYYLALTPKADRRTDFTEIQGHVREKLTEAVPEAQSILVSDIPWFGSGGSSNAEIMFSLEGSDIEQLRIYSEQILRELRKSKNVVDVVSSLELGKPEIQFHVDRRRAGDLSVSTRSIADSIRIMVGGATVATFQDGGDRFDVRVQMQGDQRADLANLNLIQVRNADGLAVDLANVAGFEVRTGAAQIDRRNRSRNVSINANLAPGVVLGDATNEIEAVVRGLNLPDGYQGAFVGKAEMMDETIAAIVFAFVMALTALYMILASQFNSFVQPGIIMLTAPLSFMGAFVFLALAGGALTLFTQIGLVALMGLVMKNGILLVDYANHLRRVDPELDAVGAMLQAAPVRLRPVLMTAISTISGMIPVSLSNSQGAEFRNAMGTLVIGGMTSSTFLTLIVVPAAYCAVSAWSGQANSIFGRLKSAIKLPVGIGGK